MSLLPSGWAITNIAEIGDLVGGKTPSKAEPCFWANGTVPWVSPKDMKVFDLAGSEDQISEAAISDGGMNLLPAQSILMVTRSGILSHTFPVAITRKPVTINQDIKAIAPAAAFNTRYLAYNLKSQQRTILNDCAKSGTTVESVETGQLKKLPIPLAPLPEQKRIADKLDSVLARVDACRDRLDRLPALLKRFRQSILAAATSGRLTEDWRVGQEISWEEVHLSDIGEFGRGKSKHRPRNDPRLYGGPHPFVQTGDVTGSEGVIRKHTQTYSDFGLAQSKLWPAGTLCITIAANIADTAILSYPACFPDSIVGFSPDESKCSAHFVKWVIDVIKEDLERFAPATAQKNINLGILSEIAFKLPSLPEQTEIVRRVEILFAFADRLEARLASARRQVGQLTPALLAKAFRGELVAQDPADEPAAELLKRIAAQREVAPKVKRGRAKG